MHQLIAQIDFLFDVNWSSLNLDHDKETSPINGDKINTEGTNAFSQEVLWPTFCKVNEIFPRHCLFILNSIEFLQNSLTNR